MDTQNLALTWLCVMDFRDLDEKLHDGDFDTEACEQVDWQRLLRSHHCPFLVNFVFFAAAVIATLLDGGDVKSQLEEAFTAVSKVHDQASDALSTIVFERHTAILNAGPEIECAFIGWLNVSACTCHWNYSVISLHCPLQHWRMSWMISEMLL